MASVSVSPVHTESFRPISISSRADIHAGRERDWREACATPVEPGGFLPPDLAVQISELSGGARNTRLTAADLVALRTALGATLLYEAIQREAFGVAWWCLNQPGGAAAASIPNRNGEIPLMLATRKGNLSLAKALLDTCKDDKARVRMITWKCKSGHQCPLFSAVRSGNLALCEWLWVNGASRDISWVNDYNNTCLYFAATNGFDDVCKWLVLRGAQPRLSDFASDTRSKPRPARQAANRKAASVRRELGAFVAGEIRVAKTFHLAIGRTVDEYAAGTRRGACDGACDKPSREALLLNQPRVVCLDVLGYLGVRRGTELRCLKLAAISLAAIDRYQGKNRIGVLGVGGSGRF